MTINLALINQKIIKPPIRLLLLFVGLPVFAVLRLLQPVFNWRFGHLIYSRLGELATNTELYLRRRKTQPSAKKEWHIFFSGRPANEQLLKMQKRVMCIIENKILLHMYWKVRQLTSKSPLWFTLQEWKDPFEDFTYTPPQLSFTDEEEKQGQALLSKMGIKQGEPFVCLHVRDSAYLEQHLPGKDSSAHDFRDCHIKNYALVINYLISKGFYVLRMGKVVKDEIPVHHPKVIDYARQYHSDFGDIYLSAKCKFFIGTDGGLITVPWLFNVPVAYTNTPYILYSVAWRKGDVYISKKLWDIKRQRYLSYREILAYGADKWWDTKLYRNADLEVVENTPDEILDLVKEMHERLEGIWVKKDDEDILQKKYRSLYPPDHYAYGHLSRIGTNFLRNNRYLLEENPAEVLVNHEIK